MLYFSRVVLHISLIFANFGDVVLDRVLGVGLFYMIGIGGVVWVIPGFLGFGLFI